MALSGLGIYKHLPKTNCKECGFATCLAFAMQLAAKKVSLDACPHVTREAKAILESASQPPVKLVTIGTGSDKIEIGNETVMFRHEQKFYHHTAVAVLIEDTTQQSEVEATLSAVNAMRFERVGQVIKPNAVCLKNSSKDPQKFKRLVSSVMSKKAEFVQVLLASPEISAIEAALELCAQARPLIAGADAGNIDTFIPVARRHKLPLAIAARSLDEASELSEKAKNAGLDELVLELRQETLAKRIELATFARRMALKRNFRPLGFPFLSFTTLDREQELAEAIVYVAKYAGIVVIKNRDRDVVQALLVARQDIYTDPQKPVQVESKIYEVGRVSKSSPVLITTNFSITYFTVLGEVEASKVPSYIIPCDTEGMSVLTAWAAEKFTAETIAATLKKHEAEKLVTHKSVIIPGYVSVLSGKLEDESGWRVQVGPKEASGIPNYLKGWKS